MATDTAIPDPSPVAVVRRTVLFGTLPRIAVAAAITTAFRLILQPLIPAETQTVLPPSAIAAHGLLPVAFTVYAMIVYPILAGLFILVRDRLTGPKALQGLAYGATWAAVWAVYLWEPMPHTAGASVAGLIAYPLADGAALLLLGLLTGVMLGQTRLRTVSSSRPPAALLRAVVVAACLVAGRLLAYNTVGLYSVYQTNPGRTITWAVATGLVAGLVVQWFVRHLAPISPIRAAGLVGLGMFGTNLVLFNFFVPLALDVDIADLALRTIVDVASVTLGLLFITTSLALGKTSARFFNRRLTL